MEGTLAGKRRAIDIARKDVPTCRPGEPVATVRGRVEAAGEDYVIAVYQDGVVAGRIRGKRWDEAAEGATVEETMELAPKTIRPDVFVADIIEAMRSARALHWLVTGYGTHEGGRLLGVLFRDDVERVLGGQE